MLKETSSKAALLLVGTTFSSVGILFTPLGKLLTPPDSFGEHVHSTLNIVSNILGDNVFEIFQLILLPVIFFGTLAFGFWLIMTAITKGKSFLLLFLAPAIIYMNILAFVVMLLVLFHNVRFGF